MAHPNVPTLPFKPKRWNGFLSDIKEESLTFKKVLKTASTDRDNSNNDFEKFAQKSFNSIHNVARKKPDPCRNVPRLSRPRTRNAVERRPMQSPFEYEMRVANHDRWPVRPSSATHVLRPIKLNDYPGLERPKDIVCVMGAPIDPLIPI